jgi:hypothetical protein
MTNLDMVQDKSLSVIIHQVTCLFPGTQHKHCFLLLQLSKPAPPSLQNVSDGITITTTIQKMLQHAAMVNKSSNSMPALQLTMQITFLQMTLYKHSLSSSLPKNDSASINSRDCLSSPDR